ncbi:Serine/threonine protein kinase [Colletotrichum sp. SAR 10_70]|nr:Serine/threonine protein kinase [Colletotrichum sp. SAR 10_71]KAI8197952.1 Serine/threonine protein kinase [Colletotrichum sp. SAR 10_65]KAI8199617.1 Serine/threonine protein kinase [Colletotrichum sp. SAR 10_70]KAI8213471.1 Serine/threonine protein kinase [Colletotrichum sp. SAR 10_76]
MASRRNDQLSSNTEDISITLRIPDYKHDGAAPATYLLGSHNVIEADSTKLEENGDKLLWEEKVFDSLDCADFNVSETTFAGLDPDYNKSDQTVLKTYNAKDVADDMRCSFEVSVVNDEAFLPHNKLCDIINLEVVSGLLRATFKSYDEVEIARMTAEVLGKDCKSGCSRKSSRLKIFAILIMMGKISLIRDFIDYEVMDKHLPLKVKREKAEKAPRSKVTVRLYKRSKDATLQESERDGPNTVDDLEPLEFSGLWSSNDVEDFESRQKTIVVSAEVLRLSDLSNAGAKSLVELKQGKCKEKRWGRHGDIKPENILWFQEYEKIKDFLVISDFGLTSFNTTNSRSKLTAFLDFIEEKMLVPVSTERPDCRKIMAEIANILAMCPPDVEYENGINPMFIRVEEKRNVNFIIVDLAQTS